MAKALYLGVSMFEEEANKWANSNHRYADFEIVDAAKTAFIKGAELGYKKATQWHYIADKELPEIMHEVLICLKNECLVSRAKRLKGDLWTSPREDFNTKEIYAWRELPSLPDMNRKYHF